MVGRRKVARDVPAIGADALSQDVSDAELLRRHVAGDAEAFGMLFARHKDRLWAVALRTTCDPEEAADALQEAMISAFRQAKGFRGDSAVTTWLHRIVVNASLDRLRRRPARSVSWSGDPEALESLLAHDGGGGPSVAAIDTRLDVDAALRVLPAQQRAALVLVDMLGYPVAEVAAILSVSEGTVKSRCARGRARLLPYLAHLRGDSAARGNQPGADTVSPEQLPSRMGDSHPPFPQGGGG
jgi:RNA polymerase sigma-70 factor, ECF subfamily